MTIPELLRKFLAESDALAPFERNFRRVRGAQANPIDLVSAFDWSASPEGFDYWNKLNEEYDRYVLAQAAKSYYGDDDGRAD